MGLAVTLSLVFLRVCLFHFGYSFKSLGKAFATVMVSKPMLPTFYLYKLPVFSKRERVVEISYC